MGWLAAEQVSTPMARYKVIVAYDGTEFAGFQRQAKARTVQGVIETALQPLGWSGRSLLAAGRTDTGVHASGQVVAFDLDWRHTTLELQAALNAALPVDVVVRQVQPVQEDFHPRYDALARRYRYSVLCQEVRDPLRERYSWRVWPPLEFDSLKAAARMLLGTHDFAAFGTPPRVGGSTIRTVLSADWEQIGQEMAFEIMANAFLFRMVRRIVYILAAVALGRLDAALISRSLEGQPDQLPAGLAPPHGLTLVEVIYPGELE